MSDKIFYRNIEAMKDRFSNIIDYLYLPVSEKEPIPEENGITVEVTRLYGKSVMCVTKDNKAFQLDSLYETDGLLRLWYESLDRNWNLGSKLLMYGLGNGMFARTFLKYSRDDCSIVVHEPSEKLFRAAIENYDLTDLFSDVRLRLVFWPLYKRTEDMSLFYDDIFEYRDLDSLKISYYTNYPRIFREDCREYLSAIQSARDYIVANQNIQNRFGKDYNRNIFNNLKYIPESLSFEDLISKMPEDIPAIIVAAGPSLDRNINDLRDAKGKSIIISTDTALRPLALAGIEPDIAVIMDGKKDKRYLSEVASRSVPLFCTPKSGETFMNLHIGKKFFSNDGCDHIKRFMEKAGCMFQALSTGGSVANACFGLAKRLHCKRIILVGQDLAYTGDLTHSRVTVRGETETALEDLEHVIMGVDIFGNPVRTSEEFKIYKELFENEITMDPSLQVTDATEGGIRIEGTYIMSLKEAVKKECTKEFDFHKIIEGVKELLSEEQKRQFVEYIHEIPEGLINLRGMVKEALCQYEQMSELVRKQDYDTKEFGRLYRRSRELGEQIENSSVIEYVHDQLQEKSSELLGTVNRLEDDEKNELMTVCELGTRHLKDMLGAVKELEDQLTSLNINAASVIPFS